MTYQQKLSREIIELSVSNNWDEAKLEWKLLRIYMSDEQEYCLCGHYPIREVCVLLNKKNDRVTEVGNICVNKFLDIPTDRIFTSIKRIVKDCTKSVNAHVIEYAHDMNAINNWEREFYMDIMRKRILSTKQSNIKEKINKKLLSMIKKQSG